jgi:drug/metabolite transporter (DMT)-like permease
MWFLFALLGAMLTTVSDVLIKRAAARLPAHIVGLATMIYSLPLLCAVIPLAPASVPGMKFWIVIAIMVPFELAAMFLYIRGITVSPLSLTVPFMSFTPVLLVLTAPLVLGEHIGAAGVAGIAAVAAGAYLMNIGGIRRGLLEPFKAVFREKGPPMMLAAAAMYALTSALAKKGIMISGPYLFQAVYIACLAAVLAAGVVLAGRPLGPVLSNWRTLAPIGLVLGAAAIAMNISFVMAPVAYAIAVKRLSLLFGVVAGRLVFNEADFTGRITGAALMLAGVIFLAFGR